MTDELSDIWWAPVFAKASPRPTAAHPTTTNYRNDMVYM
ncbi:hypothetical protein D1AOALGA4SA_6956 [Olavius algarvensis Delta 1 endosymbiont]|nr:hypothetical protein D1AOALGA4SA_6956 [Olavius algarvensis Delta 1 endosymbiont]